MDTSHRQSASLRIGYARVSTHEQSLDSQIDALKQAGCERIYCDRISGTKAERPELDRLRDALRPDDTLVVWRLDRLGRSLRDLIAWTERLAEDGVASCSKNSARSKSTATPHTTAPTSPNTS